MAVHRPRVTALLGAAIVVALAGAACGLLRQPAAAFVLIALSIAIVCTGLRHRYRKDPRR